VRGQKGMQDYLSKIQNWRKNKSVIHNGKLMHFVPQGGVYTYFRYNNDEVVMVLLNKNETEKTVSTSRFSEIMEWCKSGKEIITDKISLEIFQKLKSRLKQP
jgi:neopullulanase